MTARPAAGRGAPACLPAPPSLPEPARAVWERLAPLVPDGRLNPATADMFAMLCTQVATWHEANQLIAETGLLAATDTGAIGPSAALAVRSHADAMTARWAAAFGIAPDRPAAAPGKAAVVRHLREA